MALSNACAWEIEISSAHRADPSKRHCSRPSPQHHESMPCPPRRAPSCSAALQWPRGAALTRFKLLAVCAGFTCRKNAPFPRTSAPFLVRRGLPSSFEPPSALLLGAPPPLSRGLITTPQVSNPKMPAHPRSRRGSTTSLAARRLAFASLTTHAPWPYASGFLGSASIPWARWLRHALRPITVQGRSRAVFPAADHDKLSTTCVCSTPP